MESFIRISLLLTAAIIFGLIIFDALKRKNRQNTSIADVKESEENFSADSVLGLDKIEPQLMSVSVDDPAEEDVNLTQIEMDLNQAPKPKVTRENLADDLLIMYVLAKPGQTFSSYHLLQTILATDLQYGEMNIFHYHTPAALGRVKLFSLASATEPGDFDLDQMGNFTCKGLTLFADLASVPDAEQTFELMLKTAEQLAEDLDGMLYADHKTPLTANVLKLYQQKILKFKTATA